MVSSPETVAAPSSPSSTLVERNVMTGNASASKKSAPRTTCSRNSGGSTIETDSTRDAPFERDPIVVDGDEAGVDVRERRAERRDAMCLTANCTVEWVGSISYVPATAGLCGHRELLPTIDPRTLVAASITPPLGYRLPGLSARLHGVV